MGKAARRRRRESPAQVRPARDTVEVVADEESLERLRQVSDEHKRLASELEDRIRQARAAGATWTELARALGVSPQAVQQRYGRTS